MKTKMKTNIACHLLLATAAVLTSISPVHAEDGGPKIIRERIMWCDKRVEETGKTDLPRVLFIGDSISAGYRGPAQEALKGTPMAGASIYIAGTAAAYKDIQDAATNDLLIAGIAAISLILLIMMFITRSLVAALVIVGTVVLSLGASFGLSVLIWQYILGIKLHWIVLPMSVIVLLAVGSDYNLLLVSRMKEELAAGVNTGIIRAMAGTGKVVTNAGLVFAFTVAAMIFSELRSIGQVGTTIGLGLLFDTLIVRSFMTPSVAALLGRWFWWPEKVRPRPASSMLREYGARPWVRELLEKPEDRESADRESTIDTAVSRSTTVG